MTTDRDKLRNYYAQFDEWGRKDSAVGRFEFERGLELITSHVEDGGHLLDLGGGAGRYTIALAESGYEVTLADLSPRLLRQARQFIAEAGVDERIASIDEVDATDLNRYDDGSFDAVVAFGPFYHLTLQQERARAAAEINRVLRPGGIVLAAFIPWQSGVSALIHRAAHAPEQVDATTFERAYRRGVFHNADEAGFQEGYYARPEQMQRLFEDAGFDTTGLISLRGLADVHASLLGDLKGDLRQAVFDAVEDCAGDRDIVASCGHAVYVGRYNTLGLKDQ